MCLINRDFVVESPKTQSRQLRANIALKPKVICKFAPNRIFDDKPLELSDAVFYWLEQTWDFIAEINLRSLFVFCERHRMRAGQSPAV